jgi:hypothetical protein
LKLNLKAVSQTEGRWQVQRSAPVNQQNIALGLFF